MKNESWFNTKSEALDELKKQKSKNTFNGFFIFFKSEGKYKGQYFVGTQFEFINIVGED